MLTREEIVCNVAEEAARKQSAEFCVVPSRNGTWKVYPYAYVVNTPAGRMFYADKHVRAVDHQGKWRQVTVLEFIKARAKYKVLPDARILAHLRHCFSFGPHPDKMTVEATLRDICREQAEACFGLRKQKRRATRTNQDKKPRQDG